MIQERLQKVEDIKHCIELNKVSLNSQHADYVSSAGIDDHLVMLDRGLDKPN